MLKALPPGPEHTIFTEWALQRGTELNGIAPCMFPGRGVGVVAQRSISAGEQLVKVPLSTIFTINAVDRTFRNRHSDVTVHGLLASFLAFGNDAQKEPFGLSSSGAWRATWPTTKDFVQCMPILWPESVLGGPSEPDFERLPPGIGGRWATIRSPTALAFQISGHLHHQKQKLRADWQKVKMLLPDADEETYTYFWLIVNTRSFYYIRPGTKTKPRPDDCMALCPFIDYFNHADHGCSVDFNEEGFAVISDRVYEAGEEIFTSYGGHSNDFLLTEYGFILDESKWDSLLLDDLILPHLDPKSRKRVSEAGYLGNYNLSSSGLCFRTHVAIRAILLDHRNFNRFVNGKPLDRDLDDTASVAESVGSTLIFNYWHEAQTALEGFGNCGADLPRAPKDVLVKRWKQIQTLLLVALAREGRAAEDAFGRMRNQVYGASHVGDA